MEGLVSSKPTIIGETDLIGVEQIIMDPEFTPDEVSLNEKDPVPASPTTSGKALMVIHPDEDGPHPGVLNEDVLENVFKHIINRSSSSRKQKRQDKIDILEDVRNIRLVCKTWKKGVTRLYRRVQAPTEFDQDQDDGQAPSERLKSFLEVMKNSDMIPVQNYIFQSNYLKSYLGRKRLKDFLLTCGSDIVSLYLSFDHLEGIDITGLGGLKLEKLKKLEIHLPLVNTVPRKHKFRIFLRILMNSAVAIEEFKFDYGYWHSFVPMKQFARIICQVLSRTVKTLHMPNMLLDEENFATLAVKGMKLEEFQLDASCFRGNERAIRKFLESQANTIKTLLIWRMCDFEISTEFDFPRLNGLLCLEISGIRVKPFPFTKKFPKLQKLDVGGWHESELVELLSYEKIVPSVKEVVMSLPLSSSWKSNAQVAKTISEHFPNITVLRISHTPCWEDNLTVTKALREVFIHFPNIEQLYISIFMEMYVSFNADSLLSGVSGNGCKRIRREANFTDVNLKNEQSKPSILNLTKLKKLVVTQVTGPRTGDLIVTDMAAHFVFLQMTSLKELTLSSAQMSPKYIELLENKLALDIEFNFTDDDEVSQDSESDSDFFLL